MKENCEAEGDDNDDDDDDDFDEDNLYNVHISEIYPLVICSVFFQV